MAVVDGISANTTPRTTTTTPQLRLVQAVCYLPHPDKLDYGGEDAHFISPSTNAMGVADGVGGWAESGVNPAEYSRTLMAVASAHVEGRDVLAAIPERTLSTRAVQEYKKNPVPPPPPGVVDPQVAIDVAHRLTRLAGSATACVVQLDPYSESLVGANVGDSGFMIVRDGEKLAQSRPLEHFFDCPLQLGAFPEFVQATDSADDADLYDIPVKPGDVIIVGSDGLWDNCYDSELVQMVPRSVEEVQRAAEAMAALARTHATDPEFASPYIQEARQNGFDLPWWEKVLGARINNGRIELKDPTGGKLDDITVLVGFVEHAPEVPLEQEDELLVSAAVSAAVERAELLVEQEDDLLASLDMDELEVSLSTNLSITVEESVDGEELAAAAAGLAAEAAAVAEPEVAAEAPVAESESEVAVAVVEEAEAATVVPEPAAEAEVAVAEAEPAVAESEPPVAESEPAVAEAEAAVAVVAEPEAVVVVEEQAVVVEEETKEEAAVAAAPAAAAEAAPAETSEPAQAAPSKVADTVAEAAAVAVTAASVAEATVPEVAQSPEPAAAEASVSVSASAEVAGASSFTSQASFGFSSFASGSSFDAEVGGDDGGNAGNSGDSDSGDSGSGDSGSDSSD